MARRRGRQSGYLRNEGKSWIGYWWEEVRRKDGTLGWHKECAAICPTQKVDPDSGRLRKVTIHQARAVFEEAVLNNLQIRTLNPRALATVEEFVDLHYRPPLVLLKRKTQEHRRNMLDNHILPAIGKLQLRDVRPDIVERLILQKVAQGKSPQTVWHIRTAISNLFKKAKRVGWFSGDLPTEGIEMPKLSHRQRIALTRQQLIALLEALPFMTRAFTLAAAITGMRTGELLGLRWRRLNLTDQETLVDGELLPPQAIAVRESFVRVHGKKVAPELRGGQYQSLKSDSGKRDIPLTDELLTMFRILAGREKFVEPKDPVFAARNGSPLDAHNELTRRLKPAVLSLKLPRMSWHDLRHTASTLADQAGLTETERQKILGHGSAAMTRRYTKASLEHARSAMAAISEGMGSLGNVVEIRKKKAG